MKCVIVTLLVCVPFTTSQFMPISKAKSPCDSSAKNSLVEHFFNLIFTEFYTAPPVCVCVQMCAGQSTYCYPNGCLKRDDLKRVDSPQSVPNKGDKIHQYMFVVDEKNDFMKDFLEKTYPDELTISPNREVRDMRPDVFKDKYSMLVKNKKIPNIELRYNLREQVKNMKSDLLKIETGDLSKTRWPMNKRNVISGHKIHSKLEKRTPIVGNANYFMSMLNANDVAGYPPKYFKRDIAKSLNDEEANVNEMYLLENDTDRNANETISLETLIENLINNSFRTKHHNTRNDEAYSSKTKLNDANNKTNDNTTVDRSEVNTSKPLNLNESINVISINSTNERVDKNKYIEDSVSNSTNIFNEMIISLSKRIEKQNNTSLEIAKRVVGDFDEKETTTVSNETTLVPFDSTYNETGMEGRETEIFNQITTPTADFMKTMVTVKNRQKRARRLQNIKNTK